MPSEFWFSFALLSFLRLNRRCTWLGVTVSTVLTCGVVYFYFVPARWLDPWCGPPHLDFYRWLSAATWITTLIGMRQRDLALWALQVLILCSLTAPSLLGLLTGVLLNLSLPRQKTEAVRENFGIYRIPMRC